MVRYVAAVGQGRMVKGTVRAASEVAAQNLLVGRGYTPITLETVPPTFSLEGMLPSFFAVKPREVITFSRQLATLLESGITLLPAIQLLSQQASTGRPFRRILDALAQDLGIGRSFSEAVARHSTVFNEIYTRTIGVGERTGKLEAVLRELANHMEKQSAFAKKVSGALAYPILVLVVAMGVAGILLIVALPPLADMFKTMNVPLPLPTRMLIGLSIFINTFKLYLGLLILTTVPALLWIIRRPQGRRALDRLRFTIPFLGPPAHMAELARMSRTMAIMLGAGLTLQDVMDIMPHTTTNLLFRDALNSVRRGLVLGQGLSHPMSLNPLFPPLLLQMVRVGEETNALESSLRVVADFYETTAAEKSAAVLSMIQPVSTIAIAAVAAFIALSVIMPMYNITGAFK
ncbi:MAG: type II secretion system F family protein [Chloroflexi bacterium]|nr:type II secretion system F family protein [Chloroflexota bacterium]